MTNGLKLALLALSFLFLVGLGLSALLVSNAQKERRKRDARFTAVVSPHLRVRRLEVSAFILPLEARDQSLIGIAARVFGFDPINPNRYPLPWWLAICTSLAISQVVQMLLAEVAGPASILIVPVGSVMLSRGFLGWFDGRRREQMLAQFSDALTMIIRSVRVGIPVQEAIRGVAREAPHPTGPEFARLVSRTSVGVSMDDAMAEMAVRAGIQEYRFFATALSLQNQTGGTLSETLENLADMVRKRVALKARGHALASEAKASATVLVALPFVTGIALWVLNPEYISLLITDPTGHTLLASAAGSLAMGIFTIRTMIRRSLNT